jgi:hypothetical protein
VFQSGHVLEVNVTNDTNNVSIWNVHNFDVPRKETQKAVRKIKQQTVDATKSPLNRAVFVSGDWNFLPTGEFALDLAAPERTDAHSGAINQSRPGQGSWQEALGRLVEIHQLDVTHFCSKSWKCSRLDRFYCSIPAWALLQLAANAAVVEHPKKMHDDNLSDHAPVKLTISTWMPLPRSQQPIPTFVVNSSAFKKYHQALCDQTGLSDLGTIERWQTHKVIIREAARLARRQLFLENESSEETKHIALQSIARAVWRNDTSLAEILADRSPLAQKHLAVDSQRNVIIHDAPLFQAEVEAARAKQLESRLRGLELDGRRAAAEGESKWKARKRQDKVAAASRLAKLWSPFDRRLVLNGIRTCKLDTNATSPDEAYHIVRGGREKAAALSRGWCNTFAERKQIDLEKACAYLARWATLFDYSKVKPPTTRHFESFRRRRRLCTGT